jgi:hypothetical protein
MNNITAASGELVSGLVPERLATSAAEAVRDILQEAEAPNTIRSYAGALRYWAGWFEGAMAGPSPYPSRRQWFSSSWITWGAQAIWGFVGICLQTWIVPWCMRA